ncbi:DctP family TRAP transporter solute-binding subunit [Halobacillus salinarum]|uniref:DctP family TRAP transporter solute-binding subunit n=1 Tax=Halobacillus salinarum TaxID=2932257 RepID=A0ABY4EI60_9BACI|nr:DctP family TRAP transporter solute-binding subunit [Halobacillus salinarum]UOQ44168.1 DctP family TRAP transporter solute-binding subunit [Halobacillus salinarum]
MRILLVFLSTAMLLAGCGSGGSETTRGEDSPKYVFRFVHEESPSSVQNSYVEEFKKKLEEKSNGEIAVDIYPVGQLGNAVTQFELVQMGAVDFAIVSPGNIGTFVPESQVLLLNFLFSDNMDVNRKVLNESPALYDLLSKKFEEKGVKPMSYWTEGFNDWTSNKQMQQPQDFEGVKFRTMPSPLIVSSYQAYGANPTPVPYEQVYSGLQLGMIDGETNPLFAIEQMKFYEVQSHLTLSRHSLYTTSTVVNKERYERLPSNVQNMIDETIEEMKGESFEIQKDYNQKALKAIKKNSSIKINELSERQRKTFKEKAQSVQKEYVERVGKDGKAILEQLKKDIQQAEKETESQK